MTHAPHQKRNTKSHNSNEPQIPHIELIEGEVQKRMVNPQESSYCNCNICLVNYQLKERGKAFLRQTSSSLKIESYKLQEFFGLICAVSAKTYMRLDIPEICFFFKGDPKKLYRSNNSGVHQIELNSAVRKNLANIFLENKRTISNNNNKNKQSALSFYTGEQDTHIKNFGNVIPSFKYGEHVQTNKPIKYIFHNNPNYS